jgi:hypothetical protein
LKLVADAIAFCPVFCDPSLLSLLVLRLNAGIRQPSILSGIWLYISEMVICFGFQT